MFSELGMFALEEAKKRGAMYADIRIGEILDEVLTVKNGAPEEVKFLQTKGFGVRVIVNGAWGFAASVDINKDEISRVVDRAISIAKASAKPVSYTHLTLPTN